MSIRQLTLGSGQYGIKRQVVHAPINVPNTVQCLPRNIPDVAINVHLKHRLVRKLSYKKSLVKELNIHKWLKHLEHSPLYKYVKIEIDCSHLANMQDDSDVDDDEIKPVPEVTDLKILCRRRLYSTQLCIPRSLTTELASSLTASTAASTLRWNLRKERRRILQLMK